MKISENVQMSNYTTLKTGGVVRYMVETNSVEEVVEVIEFANQLELPIMVMGGGSNVLFAAPEFRGVVIKINILGRSYKEDVDLVEVRVGAGELLDDLVAETVSYGYWGLENLSAIPGTVGATPVQNVGAYGVEVEKYIVSVETINRDTKEIKIISNQDCKFGYRDSFFKTAEGRKHIIIAVNFSLSKKPAPLLAYADLASIFSTGEPAQLAIREAIIEIRSKKFPDWKKVGTAGSFFKNPIIPADLALSLKERYPAIPLYPMPSGEVKVSLGYVLDKICGLKGFRDGDVGLYSEQALVLVQYGQASADKLLQFVEEISSKVFELTNIKIESEVQIILS